MGQVLHMKLKQYYQSKAWCDLRKMKLDEVGHKCDSENDWCGGELQVHHKTYTRFGGDEFMRDLQVLCRSHHQAIHKRTFTDDEIRQYNKRRVYINATKTLAAHRLHQESDAYKKNTQGA